MKAIIIDDELNARLALREILEENFPDVEILDECSNVPDAVQSIHKNNPNLVFLDVSTPGYSGLELFKFFEEFQLNFKVIFVTAHSEYAINAFELSAVDYILKPLKISALKHALEKVMLYGNEKVKTLSDNLNPEKPNKVALQTGDGISILRFDEIIYLKAGGAYTHFITDEDKVITISRKISEYEKLAEMGGFMRIHRSHIVNINRIKRVLKQDGGVVEMDNGDMLSISKNKKEALLESLKRK